MFKGARISAVVALLAVAAGLALAACGSSSSSTSASAGSSGSSTTSTGSSATGGRGGGLFSSLTSTQKACLKSHGVTIPAGGGASGGFRPGGGSGTSTRPSGTRPTGGTSGSGAPAGAPGGANSSKFTTALKDCDITITRPTGGGPGGAPGGSGAPSSSTAKPSATALKEFQACVVKHGYDLTSAEINTSGTGAVLSKSLETNQKFLAAAKDCEQYLQSSAAASATASS